MAALRRNTQAVVDGRQGRPPFAEALEGLRTEVLAREVVVGVADLAPELEPLGGRLHGAPEIRAGALESGEPSGALAQELAVASRARRRDGLFRDPRVIGPPAVTLEPPVRRVALQVGAEQRVLHSLSQRDSLGARGPAALGIVPRQHARAVER